jgi:hypothetical protein
MFASQNVDAKFNSATVGHQLRIIKSGNGTVKSNLSGIDCGTDCEENYLSSVFVELTPYPAPGSVFDGWGGDEFCPVTKSSAVCRVRVRDAMTIEARFK